MTETFVLDHPLARNVIMGYPEDVEWDEGFDPEELKEFLDTFELVHHKTLGDPEEDWYRGVTFTVVYRRKVDGKLFGYSYWEDISKHGEVYIEPNTDDYRYEFREVEMFPVAGYRVLGGD